MPARRPHTALIILTLAAVPLVGCTPERAPAVSVTPHAPTASPSADASPSPSADEVAAATTALFDAVARDDHAAIAEAIDAGADLETRDSSGRTPLVIATKNNSADTAIQLLEAGADPDTKDDIEDSAFLYAGAEGYDRILEETIRHGADVTSTNRFGGTALIPASEHGYAETVRILLAAGVPVDHVNDLGWTALLEAVLFGDGSASYVEVVGLLVEAGADTSIADFQGRTARDTARDRGHAEIVRAMG